MRPETEEWLGPMFEAAAARDIDILPLMTAASMPAAEADTPIGDWLAKRFPAASEGPVMRAVDWVRFGQLLRHELGWDDTYPAYPDFPEAQDTP
jgi:hypothetical protein